MLILFITIIVPLFLYKADKIEGHLSSAFTRVSSRREKQERFRWQLTILYPFTDIILGAESAIVKYTVRVYGNYDMPPASSGKAGRYLRYIRLGNNMEAKEKFFYVKSYFC